MRPRFLHFYMRQLRGLGLLLVLSVFVLAAVSPTQALEDTTPPALVDFGFSPTQIETSSNPAWLTLSISDAGQRKISSRQAINGTAARSVPLDQQQLLTNYGRMPLRFEVNRGQTDAQVKFLSRGGGYTLFLTPAEAVVTLSKRTPVSREDEDLESAQSLMATPFDGLSTDVFADIAYGLPRRSRIQRARMVPSRTATGPPWVVRMKLVDANPAAEVVGLDQLPGTSSYFIGNDPKKWRTDVPSYSRVKYSNVYPGVDLLYYGNGQELEHDFIVKPGADPVTIALQFEGSDKLSVNAQGDLVLAGQDSEVILRRPVAYQELSGRRQQIATNYVLKGQNEVGFHVAPYDATKALVIDPVLIFSTYLGSSNSAGDYGWGIAVDPAGSVYVTGLTESADFPTVNPLPSPNNGLQGYNDAFVSKLSFSGSTLSLVYSTYLGGSGTNEGWGIAVDSSGNAYVTGFTNSADFPTVNPLPPPNDALRSSAGSAFVSKLSFSGSTLSLAYSTYLGGSGGDEGWGIAVDSSGNAYVTGRTGSADFPTVNPLPPPNDVLRGSNAFVSKLTFSGSTLSLAYSTYLGGSGGGDGARAIAVDSFGNAYVTGWTTSADFPTMNPLPPPNNALQGRGNAFVSKLSFSGSTLSLAYSTYLGGSGSDSGFGIAVDSSGNAYVTGFTNSTDFPSVNPLPPPNNTFEKAAVFVSKLAFSGSALSLAYSTPLGGIGTMPVKNIDVGSSIAVDSAGNAYVTGYTYSASFPTVDPLPPPNNPFLLGVPGVSHAFVSELSFSGSTPTLIYSTYLGGEGDRGQGIAVDAAGNAYVVGWTASTDFPTVNPLVGSNNLSGANVAFVAKIAHVNTPAGSNVVVLPIDTSTRATPATLTFSTVTQAGSTSLTTSTSGPTPPAGFSLGSPPVYYALTTTATFTGPITVCINYAGISFPSGPQLFHFEDGSWANVTVSVDTTDQIICGSVSSLSPFAILAQSQLLTALGPTEAWVGLKNSDDVGVKFDFLVEVLKDGTVIGSGQSSSIPGGSSGFNNARLSTIPLNLTSPVGCCAGHTLGLRLSVRVAANSGHRSGTARLWFNDAQANTSFSATIGGMTNSYFLLNLLQLGTAAGAGPKKTIDVLVDRAVGGNPFKPFGTWTITFP